MTDKDIIRIEGCIKGEKVLCLSCPYRDQYPDCRRYVIRDIFDVAKRQKAEIERLTETKNRLSYNLQAVLDERADHTEAVKEFAEKVKSKFCNGYTYLEIGEKAFINDIDNLVKEMVGAESG